jgi:hypothetical protein
MEKKMNEKSLPHIIAVGTFVLFIALGLACASAPDGSYGGSSGYTQSSVNTPDPVIGKWRGPNSGSYNRYRVYEFNPDGSCYQFLYTPNGDVIEAFFDARWIRGNGTNYIVTRYSQVVGTTFTDDFTLQDGILYLNYNGAPWIRTN